MQSNRARTALASLSLLAFSVPVTAQDNPYVAAAAASEDAEAASTDTSGWYPVDEAPEGTPLFSVEADATVQAVAFDNADFMALDESTQEAIQDTDDRTTGGDTYLTVGGEVSPVDGLRADLELLAGATWGESAWDSTVGLAAASVDVDVVDSDAFRLSVRGGRQRFEIGGAPRDYFLSGMVDGFTLGAEVKDILTLRVLAFDLFQPQAFPEDRHTLFWERPQGAAASGQRGEINTYRTGGVLQTVDQLVDGLDVRAFFFHAAVGGADREAGTGSDISEGGYLGNFRDRDYVDLMGGRAGYSGEVADGFELGGFAEFGRSSGIDRKESTSVDVDLGGNALGVGLHLDYDFGPGHIGLAGDWHRMDGALYSVNGLEYQRGFVSMYGDEIGGLASASIAGMRPSATLSRYGVLHNPEDVDRSAGTDFVHVELGFGYQDTELELGWWTYSDTRESAFDQSTLATVEVPPEHSREEFAAQRRAGLSLGSEIDMTLRQVVRDYAALFARAGLFMPGDYYAIEVSRIVTPEAIEGNRRLGGDNATFWAFAAGAEFGFGYRRERE